MADPKSWRRSRCPQKVLGLALALLLLGALSSCGPDDEDLMREQFEGLRHFHTEYVSGLVDSATHPDADDGVKGVRALIDETVTAVEKSRERVAAMVDTDLAQQNSAIGAHLQAHDEALVALVKQLESRKENGYPELRVAVHVCLNDTYRKCEGSLEVARGVTTTDPVLKNLLKATEELHAGKRYSLGMNKPIRATRAQVGGLQERVTETLNDLGADLGIEPLPPTPRTTEPF